MRRQLLVVVSVFMAILATTAPAAAAHTTAVSTHTTASDFNGATTLNNVDVVGSGSSASVDYSDTWSDGFEDEAADSGIPDAWEAVTDPKNTGQSRSTDVEEVTTAKAYSGSQSYHLAESASGNVLYSRPADQPLSSTRTTEVSTALYQVNTGDSSDEVGIELYEGAGDTPQVRVEMRNGDLIYYDSTDTRQTISTTPAAGEWVDIRIYNIDPSTDTFAVEWSTSSNSGTATGLEMRSAMSSGYDNTIIRVNNNGYYDGFETFSEDSGTYISSTHSATNAQSGFTDLSLSNADATVTWEYHDGSSWVAATTNDYTSSGNKSVNLPSVSATDWRVNVTYNPNASSSSTGQLHDEGITAAASAPALNNSSASPQGGGKITETPTYKIDGNDSDFSDAEGDQLTLNWYRNGTLLDTTTETANGTWTFTPESSKAGPSQWHVEVSDDYGHTATSDTFTYQPPGDLQIYNESNHTQLVDNAEATIEFYFGNGTTSTTETRTTTDGTVDMSGLPADEQFIAVVDADGYHPRRIYVESLYETQRVYVLNKSQASTNTEFRLTDYTGLYPDATTVLEVERVINGSWQTVEGDYFGATGGFPATLATGQRHQLVLTNTETGRSRNLGTFTPVADSTQTIIVNSRDDIELVTDEVTVSVDPGLRRLDASDNQTTTATLRSENASLDEWQVTVTFENATTGTNTTLAQTSNTTATGGVWSSTHNLTNKAGTVYVNVTYTTQAGATETEIVAYQITQIYQNEYGLLPVLGSVKASFPSQHQGTVTSLIAVIVTMLFAGSLARIPGTSTEVIGLGAVILLAGFGTIGWLGYGPIFAGAAAWVGMSALKRGI